MNLAARAERIRQRGLRGLESWKADHQSLADRAGRWRQLVPVIQPLLLVSQIQGSGGALFTRLLDGHPECLSHPHELEWGRTLVRSTSEWPCMDPCAAPEAWWHRLQERWVQTLHGRGDIGTTPERQSLAFVPFLHRRLFLALWAEAPPRSRREIYNHYFTALFNSWADCAGIYATPKRFVVACAPHLIGAQADRVNFRQDYPDGLLVSVVRRPDQWLASAVRFSTPAWTPGDAGTAIREWKASVRETLQAREEAPEQTLVVSCDSLVTSPSDVMGSVCRSAGLSVPHVWAPAFNGRVARSDASDETRPYLDPAVVARDDTLSEPQGHFIDREAWDLYAAATDAAGSRPRGRRAVPVPPSAVLRPGPALPPSLRYARWSTRDRMLVRTRVNTFANIDAPLLLISQIQRSGGTLLARLFDGHPDCHAHPHELAWGSPTKQHWPDLPMHASHQCWWRLLSQAWQVRTAATGSYHKAKNDSVRYPMVLHRRLQKAIWMRCLAQSHPGRQRDVLNASLTAFFHAWLDYQGGVTGPRRYVTAFTPGVTTTPGSLARYWRDYPDGHLVCLVRDPESWFASARLHRHRWTDLGVALSDWQASVRSACDAEAARPDRVTVLLFDDLVGRTDATMAHLCRRTGLAFHRSLLAPTFNTMPIVSDSSFEQTTGLDQATRDRSHHLSPAERSEIKARGGDVYADACRRFRIA